MNVFEFRKKLIAAYEQFSRSFTKIRRCCMNLPEHQSLDHRRVRDTSEARGSYEVKTCLPVDVIGIYVLTPAVSF